MFVVILIIHILVCFALMAVVLMQSGKGRGLAGAFGGGGGNQTLFGGRGAVDFLGKATWVLGALFLVTSLSLAIMSGGRAGSAAPQSLIKKEAGAVPGGTAPGGAIPGGTQPAPTGGQALPGGPAPAGQTAPLGTAPAPQGNAPSSPAPSSPAPVSPPAGQPAGK